MGSLEIGQGRKLDVDIWVTYTYEDGSTEKVKIHGNDNDIRR